MGSSELVHIVQPSGRRRYAVRYTLRRQARKLTSLAACRSLRRAQSGDGDGDVERASIQPARETEKAKEGRSGREHPPRLQDVHAARGQ